MSDMEVVKIGKAAPNEDVIEQLEWLLKEAKDGKIRALMWVTECLDESHMHGITNGLTNYKALAYLYRLAHRIQLTMDVECYEPEESGEGESD